jgi:hypothetical protein
MEPVSLPTGRGSEVAVESSTVISTPSGVRTGWPRGAGRSGTFPTRAGGRGVRGMTARCSKLSNGINGKKKVTAALPAESSR